MMKNFIGFFKAPLVVIALLFGAHTHAQVVQVPPLCKVVVAGTGGTLGFGPTGKVGNGGVVTMPDPFDDATANGNFILSGLPVGATLGNWNLLGDLSVQVPTTNLYGAPVTTASTATVNIQSYNKTYRITEGLAPSVNTWGRSRGKVTISYNDNSCGKNVVFDVFKVYVPNATLPVQPTNIPAIVGPDCITTDKVYTFSVDQVASDNANDAIGFDQYYWSGLPAFQPNTLYYSADNSSITFRTALTLTYPITIKCCLGRANSVWDNGTDPALGGSATSCVTKPLNAIPVAPVFNSTTPSTLGLSNTVFNGCLSTGLTSFSLNYNLPPSGTTYTWSAPGTNWNIGFNTTGTQTMNVTGLDNSSGTLKLTISNGSCTPVDFFYQINRTFTTAILITPGTTNCLVGGVGSAFSIGPNASVNATTWTVTPTPAVGSFYIFPSTATTGVTISSSANVSPGAYTLTATSANCGGSITLAINVKPATPVFLASTPTCVPLSSPALTTIGVTPVTGATSYTWTPLPSGWSCTNCTTANPTFTPPINTSAVGGAATPPGTFSVVANSGTGCSSAAATFTVNYIRITTNTLQPGAGNCDQYSINTNAAPCTGTISSWTVGGTTAVSNGTTVNIFGNTLTLCGSTAPAAGTICANIVVNGVAYNTCSSTGAGNTPNHGLRHANSAAGQGTKIAGVSISPNPNSGTFSITVKTIKDSASATLYDLTGKNLGTYPLNTGENKVETQGLAHGTYIVSLSIDGEMESRQIIIK